MLCNFYFLGSPCPDKVLQNLSKAFVLLNIFTWFYAGEVSKRNQIDLEFSSYKKGKNWNAAAILLIEHIQSSFKNIFLGSNFFIFVWTVLY